MTQGEQQALWDALLVEGWMRGAPMQNVILMFGIDAGRLGTTALFAQLSQLRRTPRCPRHAEQEVRAFMAEALPTVHAVLMAGNLNRLEVRAMLSRSALDTAIRTSQRTRTLKNERKREKRRQLSPMYAGAFE